jgi:hypothetical protein
VTRDEWFAAGKNVRKAPRILTDAELLEREFKYGAGGRIGGRRNAESGQLASVRTSASIAKGGRRSAELGVGVHTPEMRSLAGRKGGRIGGPKGGRKNVASGHLRRISSMGGSKHVESGHLASLRTPEHQAKASRSATHIRWHVKRGLIKPDCVLCGGYLIADRIPHLIHSLL